MGRLNGGTKVATNKYALKCQMPIKIYTNEQEIKDNKKTFK